MLECKLCELKYKEIYDKLCVFCNIISNNNKLDIYNICIGYTDVSQIDIIKNIYDMIILEDKIPYPKIIDDTVILININPYIFREFIIYCKKKYYNDNDIIDNINKFKIFFTNAIDLNKIKTKKFPLKYKIEKLNIDYIKTENTLEYIDKNLAKLYKKYVHNLYYNE